MSDDAQKIKAILGKFISKNALSDGIDTARIQENWSSIMGENISAYTKEVSLKQDVLIVKLSSSVLRQELSYGKEKIVEMINKSLGGNKIQDIRFV
jgi:predicted nucleic acid-binding Zn ribbon protein|tara:strand:+ start:2358 stop:2645 length:288 start_codon:yes stop_codon:yes gene_type:complete